MRLITCKVYAALLIGLFTIASFGQGIPKVVKKFGKQPGGEIVHCASTEYETFLKKKNPARADKQQFESWLAPKAQSAKLKRLQKLDNEPNIVTIPVVYHIIHSGLPIGVEENIADGQILSQLTVLNQDYRRLANTPGFNTNPAGADTGIEFCLAQQDPNGVLTTGINRYALGNVNGFSFEEAEYIKTQTQWDPERYLNIWVVKSIYIGEGFEVGGYAQFPTSSGLDGLDDLGEATAAETDGIMLVYQGVGSEDMYPQGEYSFYRNKGRSATHEVGHFLGLRHIWGDEIGCFGSDYCDDTPIAFEPNSYCPEGLDSCPSPGSDMIENYMDYTTDACMSVFTLDQKDRMMAVLENSPRRASLLTSDACMPGMIYDNDGSLNIGNLNIGCDTSFAPQLRLTNMGENTITSAVINYYTDNNTPVVYNWTGNLTNGQYTIIDLPEINTTIGFHDFTATLLMINGEEDEAASNNTDEFEFQINPYSAYNTTQITVTVQTDNFGDETTWFITDINENLILSNFDPENFNGMGFYADNQLYTHTASVENNNCYIFTIIDTEGDGICCDYGNGYYTITTSSGTIIGQGSSFGQYAQHAFSIDTTLGLNANNNKNSIKLYPNPANTVVNIVMPEQGTYTVFNNLGQVIANDKTAAANFSLDVSGYSNGIYFIKVQTGKGSETVRFIKN